MKSPVRRLACAAMAIVAAVLASGCMTGAHIAMAVERSSADRELERGKTQLRQYIKSLQERGDPMGDYYYAMANADGWMKEVQDPKAVTALFEQAAAKGVMDAKILLALQLAMGEPVPGRLDYAMVPSEVAGDWQRGREQLFPLLQQQCFARRLVLEEGRPKAAYYSIAYKIWPKFRDGYYVQNERKEWVLKVAKDPVQLQAWESIHRNCQLRRNDFLDVPAAKR
ncbi:MAG: hypothetical protein MUF44_13240 [Hydrogenophaga sp.]|nr:hypothetical protein [Hydrogenophaga sp.]